MQKCDILCNVMNSAEIDLHVTRLKMKDSEVCETQKRQSLVGYVCTQAF
jgi:hypothetical protein